MTALPPLTPVWPQVWVQAADGELIRADRIVAIRQGRQEAGGQVTVTLVDGTERDLHDRALTAERPVYPYSDRMLADAIAQAARKTSDPDDPVAIVVIVAVMDHSDQDDEGVTWEWNSEWGLADDSDYPD
jgi:hypothetical protein